MAHKIIKHDTGIYAGLWVVEDDPSGEVLATAKTNAAAWRAADRIALEPINRSEAVQDWLFNKVASEK